MYFISRFPQQIPTDHVVAALSCPEEALIAVRLLRHQLISLSDLNKVVHNRKLISNIKEIIGRLTKKSASSGLLSKRTATDAALDKH